MNAKDDPSKPVLTPPVSMTPYYFDQNLWQRYKDAGNALDSAILAHCQTKNILERAEQKFKKLSEEWAGLEIDKNIQGVFS